MNNLVNVMHPRDRCQVCIGRRRIARRLVGERQTCVACAEYLERRERRQFRRVNGLGRRGPLPAWCSP
jgi:hypothetical protein